MDKADLKSELDNDPDKLGYASHIIAGENSTIAELLNARVTGVSRAMAISGDPDENVSWMAIVDALSETREDLATSAYLAGTWPSVAVYVPPEKMVAAGLTPAHLDAAKINSEGTALGVAEDRHEAAFTVLKAIDSARAITIQAAYPTEKTTAENAVIAAIADARITAKAREAVASQMSAAVDAEIAQRRVP